MIVVIRTIAASGCLVLLSSCSASPLAPDRAQVGDVRVQPASKQSREVKTAQQANSSSKQVQQAQALVEGLAKMKNELGVTGNSASFALTQSHIEGQASNEQLNSLGPQFLNSFGNLAKLYAQRGERQNPGSPAGTHESLQDKVSYLQSFLAQEASNTMAFTYQLQGKYKEAADLTYQRIAALEAANADHSKDHDLADSYSRCSQYLSQMGRTTEAEQMAARARAMEPSHY